MLPKRVGLPQRQPGALLEIAHLDVGRAVGRNLVLHRLAHRRYPRHGPYPRRRTGHLMYTDGNLFGQCANRTAMAVVKDEDFLHDGP